MHQHLSAVSLPPTDSRTRGPHPQGPVRLFLVGGLLLAFVILAGAVSLLNPLFESTDEIRHYRYVRHLVVERRLPIQGQEDVRSQSHHPPLYYLISALLSGWVSTPHTSTYEHPPNPFWGYRNWEVGVDNKLQYHHAPAEGFPFRQGYLAAMIPRWVNVALGGLTVLLTYRLGRRVWTERPALAWTAAALVAFNPQFIYLSGAMNNDVPSAAVGAAVLLLSVETAQRGLERRRLIMLGGVYGVGLLVKFHLLALGGVIALALALGVVSTAGAVSDKKAMTGRWLGGLGLVLGVAALLAGWWFLRNQWLYGDPTGLNKVNELWRGRSASESWWAIHQSLPYLWSSLWGRFGYGQIPLPQPMYTGLLLFCLAALAGYLLPRRGPRPAGPLLLLAVAVLGFVLVVFYYILIQPAGAMGRFLFPALPALAVMLVGGLGRWFPRRRPAVWLAGGTTLGLTALTLVALGGYLWPAVRYPPPAARPAGPSYEAQFGDVARVLGVDLRPASLQPGEPAFVTVVWEPLRQTEVPYAVYVHLIDEADALIAQRDTWPGLGRAPTDVWQPGRPFVDTYRVDLPDTAYAPNRATVRLGLYEANRGRLPAFRSGQGVGDGLALGELEIEPRSGDWPNPQWTNFGDEVSLVGYTLEPRALSAGETLTLTLYWQPQRQPEHDYLVFAQVIDPAPKVWGSRDGAGPGWTAGEVVQDVRLITLLPDTPPGSYPIQVGLFHKETGRLPVIAPGGHYLDTRVLLGPIRVRE